MRAEGGTSGGSAPLSVLVTVTFNANQLRSHLLPIVALPEVGSVTLVSDVEPPALSKVRSVVPPRLLVRVLGRAGAKLLVCLWVAVRERPDWIVGFNFVPHGLNARVVGALTGTKSLYHMIGGEIEWAGGGWRSDNRILSLLPPSRLLESLLLRLISGCTAVATMGEAGRASLVGHGIDPLRVHVLRPSVDTDRFTPSPRSAAPGYDIVTVGQLIPRKRTADLIRAVAELRRRGRTARAAIVGAGPLETEMRRLAAQLGVSDDVDFLGFREDVETLYRSARVFVLTSSFEGLPVSMLEAMATGLAAVVPNVGEIGTFVNDGEDGFLFPAEDVGALVERLDAGLADPTLFEAAGVAAAERVRATASVEAISADYRAILSPTLIATGTTR